MEKEEAREATLCAQALPASSRVCPKTAPTTMPAPRRAARAPSCPPLPPPSAATGMSRALWLSRPYRSESGLSSVRILSLPLYRARPPLHVLPPHLPPHAASAFAFPFTTCPFALSRRHFIASSSPLPSPPPSRSRYDYRAFAPLLTTLCRPVPSHPSARPPINTTHAFCVDHLRTVHSYTIQGPRPSTYMHHPPIIHILVSIRSSAPAIYTYASASPCRSTHPSQVHPSACPPSSSWHT
ncbi:hypothetical protein C8R47DRAFT_47445 [Mycena vitilis]|nr:hypothetical protein C8R47DRAFT_47445 [Mycena vitilis]